MMKKKSWLYSAAKKGITVALSVIMALSASFANGMFVQVEEAYAADSEANTYNGFTYEVTEENTVTITGYEGSDTELTIPAEIEGYPVTEIGNGAFWGRSSLRSVVIPDSVTRIGDSAFKECSNLVCVTIPKGVVSIGTEAFLNDDYGAYDLIGVIFEGEAVPEINGNIFPKSDSFKYVFAPDASHEAYVSALQDILPENAQVRKLSEKMVDAAGGATFGAYTYNRSFEGEVTITDYSGSDVTLEIPSEIDGYAVTGIGESAFSDCSSLTSVTIPKGVTSIGNYAFSQCRNLQEINVDVDNHNYMSEDGVLYNKERIELIFCPEGKQGDYEIPEGVTSIRAYAFSGCSSLTSITIPEGATGIRAYAFSGCSSLTSVTIPESVTYISSYAFHNCSSLTSVTISEGVTSIGWCAFEGCSSLTSVTIPESVTSIEYGAFCECSSLTSITIPEGVTSIGNFAFEYCGSLTTLVFLGEDVPYFTPLTWICNLEKIYVPDASYDVYVEAFNEAALLQENTEVIKLSEKIAEPAESPMPTQTPEVTTEPTPEPEKSAEPTQTPGPILTDDISYEVKENSVAINGYLGEETVVTLPAKIEGKPVTAISAGAFKDNAQLAEVTIPDGVTEIGAEAFAGCVALTEVTIPDSVTEIAADAFADSPNITFACFEGSAAYAYAVSNGISYRLLSKPVADVAYGDLDGNGDITAADALTVLQIVVKLKVPTDVQSKATDVNGDKNVSAADALLILQKVVKLIDSFPAEKAVL